MDLPIETFSFTFFVVFFNDFYCLYFRYSFNDPHGKNTQIFQTVNETFLVLKKFIFLRTYSY